MRTEMKTERANAKINLYLNVVGRRENGYHDIVSIMQTVSLCDIVTVQYHEGTHFSVRLSASVRVSHFGDVRDEG